MSNPNAKGAFSEIAILSKTHFTHRDGDWGEQIHRKFSPPEGLKTNIFVKSTRVVISLYVWQYVQFLTQVFQRLTVANIKSAIKRIDIAERNRLRNKSVKSAVRTLMKSYFTAVDQYKTEPNPAAMEEVQSKMSLAYQKIDKAVQKGVLHKNNGAHKKSRLASALKPAT